MSEMSEKFSEFTDRWGNQTAPTDGMPYVEAFTPHQLKRLRFEVYMLGQPGGRLDGDDVGTEGPIPVPSQAVQPPSLLGKLLAQKQQKLQDKS